MAVDWKAVGLKILGLFREGAEEFTKGFIREKIDPYVNDPVTAWAKYGPRVEQAVRDAIPGTAFDATAVAVVSAVGQAMLVEFGTDLRDELLKAAEQINPND